MINKVDKLNISSYSGKVSSTMNRPSHPLVPGLQCALHLTEDQNLPAQVRATALLFVPPRNHGNGGRDRACLTIRAM